MSYDAVFTGLNWVEWRLELEVAGMPREREGRGREVNREAERRATGL